MNDTESSAKPDPRYDAKIPGRTKIIVTRAGDTGRFTSFAWASKSGRLCVPVTFYGCFHCAAEHDLTLECENVHEMVRKHWIIHVATGYGICSREERDHAFELMDALDDLPGWDGASKDAVAGSPELQATVPVVFKRVRDARHARFGYAPMTAPKKPDRAERAPKWTCEFCFRVWNRDKLPASWAWVCQSAICPRCLKRANAEHPGKWASVVKGGEYANGRPDPRAPAPARGGKHGRK